MCPVVDASSKMIVLVFLMTAGFSACDKLDRTYLPPPGSKFSGGSPGDIQTPLEFGKEFSSIPTQTAYNGLPTLGDPRIELGINRGLVSPTVSTTPFPVSYFQSSHRVPSTSTSYAFTQTTTFPVDGYEITTATAIPNYSAIGPVSDFQQLHGSKLPQTFTNSQYPQGFRQSLNESQIVQPSFGSTTSPIYGAQLATKNDPFLTGQNVPRKNQQKLIASEPGLSNDYLEKYFQTPNEQNKNLLQHNQNYTFFGNEKQTNKQPGQSLPNDNLKYFPFSPNAFELYKHRHNTENVHDISKIRHPSNSYLPVKLTDRVNDVERQYQQQTFRTPAPQINHLDTRKNVAAHLAEKPNTIIPTLTSQYSRPTEIKPSNYATNFSSAPSEDYQNSVSQELPHLTTSHTSLPAIVSSSHPEIYNDSSFLKGFPKIQAEENLNKVHSYNFPGGEIIKKPLSYNSTLGTTSRPFNPGHYSTAITDDSPFQFNGNYQRTTTLSNKKPEGFEYPSDSISGFVNKPLTYESKLTPNSFQPLSPSTKLGRKGVLTPAPVFGSADVAFDRNPADVSKSIQSSKQLFHLPNQDFSTTSAPGITNIYLDYGDSSKEIQSVLVPSVDNTQYPIKSHVPQSISSTHIETQTVRPQDERDRNAVIIDFKNVITPNDFMYSYNTSNGIRAEEIGNAINGVKAMGGYSYIGDDGKVYSITYSADENGFKPNGDHLPTPPPTPEAILRMLEKNTKDEEAGIFDDGTYNADKYGPQNYQKTKNYHYEHQKYDRPSTNIPQSIKHILDTTNRQKAKATNISKPDYLTTDEHHTENDDVDEEDQTEPGVPINFIPSKYVNSNNASIKNVTINEGKPIYIEQTTNSKIKGHPEIELDSKYPISSDLNQYLPSPTDTIKDNSKFSVTNRRPDQQKPFGKQSENVKNLKNQYDEKYVNNRPKDSMNSYETNYEQINIAPTVNYINDTPNIANNQPYYEVVTNRIPERGYVYNPPKNKFLPEPNAFQMRSSAGEIISTVRPFNSRKETALKESNRKPFMTPNVSREDVNDKNYSSSSSYENETEGEKPEDQYSENEDYDSGSQVTESEILTTATSRHPEYGTAPTPIPNLKSPESGRIAYNRNEDKQIISQKPDYSSLTTLAPLRGSAKFEYASPPKDADVSKLFQYPETVEPQKNSRITGYPSGTNSTVTENSYNSTPQKFTHDNVPSTTFRPNYTIDYQNGPGGLNVDAYGIPIATEPSDEGLIEPRPTTQGNKILPERKSFIKNYYPPKLDASSNGSTAYTGENSELFPFDKAENNGNVRMKSFNEETIEAPSYPSSFNKVKGENFNGPTRNQKFDPKIGYYYK